MEQHFSKFSYEQWQEWAKRKLQGETDPIKLNKRRTNAYAELYQEAPGLYAWLGLASFASSDVGVAMSAFKLLKDFGGDNFKDLKGNTLKKGDVLTMLQKGNKAIFDDIYWQHLAYNYAGIDSIRKFAKDGKIAPQMLKAWEALNLAENTADKNKRSDLIWQATEQIAEYEQKVVLQMVFQEYKTALSVKTYVSSGRL